MDPRKIANWLVAFSVAVGLLAAPLSVPAMSAQATTVMEDMQAMSDDMPCCPGEQDQKKDCGSCPFVALCMLAITLAAPAGADLLIDRPSSQSAFALPDDLLIDGLGEHPPDQPPRTTV